MSNRTKKEEKQESIKSELSALLQLNKNRKAAMDKISKLILNENSELQNKEYKALNNK